MANFLEFEIEADEEALLEQFYQAMSEAFPGWEPAAGNYEDWLARAWARMAVETAELAADVPGEIFYRFGEKILTIPPHAAESATAQTTWEMQDDSGYTIFAGTLVSIQLTGSELIGFAVEEDAVVPPSSTVVEDVTVVAVEPGEYANAADGPVSLIDALPHVKEITLQSPTSGGADDEEPEAYLNRLATEARLLSPRPILPVDAAVLARRVPTVERSLALDLYDPISETWDNEKTVSVVVTDADGQALSSGVKDEVQNLLETFREINFVFHVIDPTYTTIDVQFDIIPYVQFNAEDVRDNVVAELTAYLSPGSWGSTRITEDATFWEQADTVYLNELIALIDGVSGVDRVVSVLLAKQGDALGAADVELDGPAPLTLPGTIEEA